MTKEKDIRELAPGETFYFQGHKLEVVEARGCSKCFILNNTDLVCCEKLSEMNLIPRCLIREDDKEVVFIEVKD